MPPLYRYSLLVVVLSLLDTSSARATKPCRPPPCAAEDDTCWRNQASWVAVGSITNVRRRPTGGMLRKDFAEFVLRVKSWEKTHGNQKPERLSMAVGWCNSAKQLPTDTVGTFRFFGNLMARKPDARGRVAVDYLSFVRVNCPKAGQCNDTPPPVAEDAQPTWTPEPRPPLEGPPAIERRSSNDEKVGPPDPIEDPDEHVVLDVDRQPTSETPEPEASATPSPTSPDRTPPADPSAPAAAPHPAPSAQTPAHDPRGPARCGCRAPGDAQRSDEFVALLVFCGLWLRRRPFPPA